MAEKKTASSRNVKEGAAKDAAGRTRKAPGAATKSTRARKAPTAELSPEERWRMVAEAAYYIAEKRGFVGGDPAADWQQAEQQVEGFLQSAKKPAKKKGSA